MSIQVKALREHPRRAGRYVVELVGAPERPEEEDAGRGADGNATVGPLDAEIVGELQLAVGREISLEAFEALEAAARRVACYDKALDALARRARAAAELGRWLRDPTSS